MLTLFQFRPIWGIVNASPFCTKLETYLKMANIPYENSYRINMKKAPGNKVPYIDLDGKLMSDSGLIIKHLKEKFGDNVDNWLTEEQNATSLAIQTMLEEQLYWVLVYSRWIDHAEIIKPIFFEHLKFPAKLFVPKMVCKYMKKQLWMQGTLRHTREQIYNLGKENVKAISVLLGDKQFMFGDQPCSLDACVHAHLANALYQPLDTPLTPYAKEFKNLVDYTARMTKRYYA